MDRLSMPRERIYAIYHVCIAMYQHHAARTLHVSGYHAALALSCSKIIGQSNILLSLISNSLDNFIAINRVAGKGRSLKSGMMSC